MESSIHECLSSNLTLRFIRISSFTFTGFTGGTLLSPLSDVHFQNFETISKHSNGLRSTAIETLRAFTTSIWKPVFGSGIGPVFHEWELELNHASFRSVLTPVHSPVFLSCIHLLNLSQNWWQISLLTYCHLFAGNSRWRASPSKWSDAISRCAFSALRLSTYPHCINEVLAYLIV